MQPQTIPSVISAILMSVNFGALTNMGDKSYEQSSKGYESHVESL